MRVRRLPYIPSLIRLSEIVSLDQIVADSDSFVGLTAELTIADTIPAPEELEDKNEIVGTEIFLLLKPGWERSVVVLLSEGFTHGSVSEITGLSKARISTILSSVRERIIQRTVRGI